MEVMPNNKKGIVFWGAGQIAQFCIDQFPEVVPEFIIDLNPDNSRITKFKIVSPDNVDNINSFFIVLTMWNYDGLRQQLLEKGMIEGEDFSNYRNYFSYDKQLTSYETLLENRKIAEQNNDLMNRIVICAPLYGEKRSIRIRQFFSRYIKENNNRNFLIWNIQNETSVNVIKTDINCEAIRANIIIDKDEKNYRRIISWNDFSDEEKEQLEYQNNTKHTKVKSFINLVQFYYFKQMFKIYKPSAFIMWGGWARESLTIEFLAKKSGIPICFGEFGWIGNTFQFDPCGIAGRSILCNYSQYPDYSYNTSNSEKNISIEEIRDQILIEDSKKEIESKELKKLEDLDRSRKTILFVGMGDAGMDINSNSIFWSKYVSDVVNGSAEAFKIIKRLCIKNSWNLIYKPHPLEKPKQNYRVYKESKSVKQLFVSPIEKLIEISDVVVSITSAVDFKTAFYKKPLVQLGKNSLNYSGSTYVVKSENDIELKIKDAIRMGFTESHWKKYKELMLIHLNTTHWAGTEGVSYGKKCNEPIV